MKKPDLEGLEPSDAVEVALSIAAERMGHAVTVMAQGALLRSPELLEAAVRGCRSAVAHIEAAIERMPADRK